MLIECKTYRYRGHSEHDAALYRDKEELIEWQSRDPIPRFEFYLEKKGHEIKSIREQIDERVNKTVQDAVDFAESSPLPEPQEALEDLYAPSGAIPLLDQLFDQRQSLSHGSHLHQGDQFGAARGDAPRRKCIRNGRGRRGVGRRVQGDRRTARRVRRGTRHRHANLGGVDHRRGSRRGGARDASRRRDAVRGFYLVRLRSDRQHCRDAALPSRRQGGVSAGDSRAVGRGRSWRAVPFAESRGVVHARAGTQSGRACDAVRRERNFEKRDSRRQPGRVLRAQAALSQHQGRSARGRFHGADRSRGNSQGRHATFR